MRFASPATMSWLQSARLAAIRMYEDNYGYHASALAFITILSIVPLFSVIIYFFTFFPYFNKLILLAKDYAASNFLPTSNSIIQNYLYLFIKQATQLPAVSIIFFLVTSVLLILTIENTINLIWHVRAKGKSFFSILNILCLILFFPLFVGLGSFAGKLLDHLLNFPGLHNDLVVFFNVLINTLIFTIFYVLVPNHRVTWTNGIVVGLFIAIVFEIVKKSFIVYIDKLAYYELIYGALAMLPIMLLWIYICWYIVLYGAILLQIKEHRDALMNKKLNP